MDPNADGWKTFWTIVAVFIAVVVIMAWSFARAAGFKDAIVTIPLAGEARVIDGDTLELLIDDAPGSGTMRMAKIRLSGIDAPEMQQPCSATFQYISGQCGILAKRELARMTHGFIVTCRQTAIDKYKRIVATCSTQGNPDLGEAMVRDGWAVRYPKYDTACRYCAAEEEARAARRGVWATEFQMPWEWRHSPRPREESNTMVPR